MKKIAILTDSSSAIYTIKHDFDNLFMIDLPCFLGEEVYSNFMKNKNEVFYKALEQSEFIPKTSQPSVGETVEWFERIREMGYTDVIYMPISKELSSTYANGFAAKDMVEGIEVTIVDTLTTVSILAEMAMLGAKLAKEGKSIEEIIDAATVLRENSGYYVTVSDLTALIKNGRLSNAAGFVANVLKIKPVIELQKNGKIASIEKVRSYKGALKKMIDIVIPHLDPNKGVLHIAGTNRMEDISLVKSLVKEAAPNAEVKVFSIPATIVAHTGMSSVALGYVNFK